MSDLKRKRVLLCSLNFAPEHSGIGPYSSEFAEWFGASSKHTSSVIAAHPHYPDWQVPDGFGQWHLETQEFGADVHRLRHYVPSDPGNLKRLLSELTFAIRVLLTRWNSPDIVVTVSPSLFGSAAAVLRARITRTPVVVWSQDLYSVGLAERPGRLSKILAKVLGTIESATYRGADQVVAIHDRFKARIAASLNVKPEKITVIRNWTHIDEVDRTNRAAASTRLGWSDDFVIAHTGAQGHKQGLDKLVRLAAEISPDLPQVKWALVGNGSQRPQIEAAAEGVSCVELIDPLPTPEFLDVLAAADAFVVCEAENVAEAAVPSKLTTYFSAGAPIVGVLDPVGITWHEVESARAGLPVTHNANELRSAIQRMVGDAELREEFATNGLDYCHRTLDRAACLSRFEALLDEL